MDKNLAKILKEHKSIKPSQKWKKGNRDLLISQIYGTEERIEGFTWKITMYKQLPIQILRSVSQPVMVVFLILFFVAFSGVASVKFAHNSRPGDPLYIAKIFGEKTQKAFTFNKKQKAKLSVEFAGKRVNEINSLLATKNETNGVAVEKLVKEARGEISNAKQSILDIQNNQDEDGEKQEGDNKNEEDNKLDEVCLDGEEKSDPFVYSANLTKDQAGMQISGATKPIIPEITLSTSSMEFDATSTEVVENVIENEEEGEKGEAKNDEDIFTEVVNLIENDEYDQVLSKLSEVDTLIDGSDVDCTNSSTTTTEEVIEDEGDEDGSDEIDETNKDASSTELGIE